MALPGFNLPGLTSLTGGGSFVPSSSASTGPFQGGDVGGQDFQFGGINTGKQNSPGWIWGAVAAVALIGLYIYTRRK